MNNSQPYYVKDITVHNKRQFSIHLYSDIQYADGKSLCINLIGNPQAIFDKSPSFYERLNLKKDSLIKIDDYQISKNPTDS